MASQRRPKPSNAHSKLLNDAENQQLFRVVGNRCVSMATAVAQIVQADPPARNKWTIKCTGVACFIKDNPLRTYFIRVYDIKTQAKIYEQEIYNQLKYHKKRPFFHTYEGDNAMTGINFANEDEANIFYGAIQEKLVQRKQRREDRKKQASVHSSGQRGPPPAVVHSSAPTPGISAPNIPTVSADSGKDTLKKKDKKKQKKSKLTKEQIGTPTDFRHVGHVGWDPDKGFDMNNLDPSLKDLFDQAGLSEQQLQDKETATFIYDFIEKHGGVEALKRDQTLVPQPGPPPMAPPMGNAPPPPPPAMNRGRNVPPPPPSRSPAMAPPPPPARTGPPPPPAGGGSRGGMNAPPPPPPSRHGAPPIPPPMAPPAPPPPPPAAMGGGGPPAPPPPPMGGGPPAPPPPPQGGRVGGGAPPPPPPSNDGRGALLNQIREGSQLKHVDPVEKEAAAPSGGRDALLDAIRGGIKLQKVDPSELENRKSQEPAQAGLAGALARALADRAKVVQGDDDDENEDDDEDDEDWDD